MKPRPILSLWLAVAVGLAACTALRAADAVHEPAKVHQRERIKFPARPLAEGVTQGRAVVMLEIDGFGELRDVLVVAHTHRDFADAVLAAVKAWRFTPATIDGEPAVSILRIVTDFRVNGVLAYSKPVGAESAIPADDEGFIYRAWDLAALDRTPAPLEQPSPIYPRAWIEAGRTGSVVVEFYIDEEGRARFPEVVGEGDEMLGLAATLAVKDWRFESPMRNGHPVLARTRQLFNFRPPPKGAPRK